MIVVGLYKRNQFRKNYAFTAGRIIEVTIPGWKSSGEYSINFKYIANNKEYSSNQEYKYCGDLTMSKVKTLLMGKQFPVAYSISDEGTCIMLLTLKNAEGFKYQLPDSIKMYDAIMTCK